MSINRMTREQRRWFNAIRKSLTPDFLNKAWRKRVTEGVPRVYGHCYRATEAAYYAFGRESGFEPHVLSVGNGVTHWWLANAKTSEVIDLTYEQIPNGFDYTLGHRKFMRLGKGPGGISRLGGFLLQRARAVIDGR